MNRSEFFKKISLMGLSAASAPALFAASFKEDKPAEQPTDTKSLDFLTKPYLQFPAPGVITVMWITNQPCFSWVEFGQNDSLSKQVESSVDGLKQAYNKIQKIRLENLKPDTRYSYKVCSKEIVKFDPYKVIYGKTIESAVYSFTTPSADKKEISLLILNDVHDRPESIPLLMGLNEEKPYDLVCFNGDIMNYLKGEPQIIKNLIQPATDLFASEKPFVYIRGNHETRGVFARHFSEYIDNGEHLYNSFTFGPAFFIVMDTGEDKPDTNKEYFGLAAFDAYREKQAKWLEQQLKSKEAKKAKFRIVLMHIPHYHSGDWHGTLHCRELFGPLFNKYKVDISISGHTHKYGIFEPSQEEHHFPMIIGGGKADDSRTIIKLHVTEKKLDVLMIKDSGEVVGRYAKGAR